MMKRKIAGSIAVLILGLLILGFLTGQGKKTTEPSFQSASPVAPIPDEAQEKLRSLAYIEGGGTPRQIPSPVSRKIIRSGEVTIRVRSLDAFSRLLENKIRDSGGYVAGFQMDRSGAGGTALVTLKLQPNRLGSFVWWLRENGNVISEQLNTQDVSEQYYDLTARLENARKLEARLLEMVRTRTDSLADLLKVEEKLSQVREQIETMEGKLRYYDALVDLATLKLRVSVESPQTIPASPSYMDRVRKAWSHSTGSLADLARGAGLVAVVSAPWIAALLPLALMLRFLVKLSLRLRHQP